MVQVIHRGDEATQGVTIPSATEGLSEFLSRVENRERYEKELQMRREKQLLDLMSVNTDNLIFEQYQGKASELLDGFVNNATSVYKNKKGVLSAEDKMNLMRGRQKVDMQVGGMRSKAQMFTQAKNVLIQDGGTDLDWEESWEELERFRKDPFSEPPSLVPAYVDPIVAIQKKLDKQHPYTRPTSVKRQMVDGSWKEDFVSYRRGLETEEAQKAWLEKQLEDRDIRRTIMSKKYYNGDINAFISEGEPLVKPVYTTDLSNVSGYSTLVLGGGNRGTIGYSNVTDPQLGETVNITGNLAPFTLNVDGNRKKVVVRAIGENGIKVDYTEVVPDKSKTGLDLSKSTNPALEAGAKFQVSADKVVQAEDGLWYPTKTESRDRVIGKDSTELGQYYDEIEKAIKAGKNTNSADFLKAWNVFKGNIAKGKKEVTSQPKKQIKRGDIKAKAKAAGYSEAEYTEMLKKNNVEIVD